MHLGKITLIEVVKLIKVNFSNYFSSQCQGRQQLPDCQKHLPTAAKYFGRGLEIQVQIIDMYPDVIWIKVVGDIDSGKLEQLQEEMNAHYSTLKVCTDYSLVSAFVFDIRQ